MKIKDLLAIKIQKLEEATSQENRVNKTLKTVDDLFYRLAKIVRHDGMLAKDIEEIGADPAILGELENAVEQMEKIIGDLQMSISHATEVESAE